MTPLGAGFWSFVRIIYFAFLRFLSVKKPSSAWNCPTSKNFKIFEKFEHRPFTWYMVLWGLNVYLDLWKQKYSSQKFSKKYKNPYFGPTLELVKITMFFLWFWENSNVSKVKINHISFLRALSPCTMWLHAMNRWFPFRKYWYHSPDSSAAYVWNFTADFSHFLIFHVDVAWQVGYSDHFSLQDCSNFI